MIYKKMYRSILFILVIALTSCSSHRKNKTRVVSDIAEIKTIVQSDSISRNTDVIHISYENDSTIVIEEHYELIPETNETYIKSKTTTYRWHNLNYKSITKNSISEIITTEKKDSIDSCIVTESITEKDSSCGNHYTRYIIIVVSLLFVLVIFNNWNKIVKLFY